MSETATTETVELPSWVKEEYDYIVTFDEATSKWQVIPF